MDDLAKLKEALLAMPEGGMRSALLGLVEVVGNRFSEDARINEIFEKVTVYMLAVEKQRDEFKADLDKVRAELAATVIERDTARAAMESMARDDESAPAELVHAQHTIACLEADKDVQTATQLRQITNDQRARIEILEFAIREAVFHCAAYGTWSMGRKAPAEELLPFVERVTEQARSYEAEANRLRGLFDEKCKAFDALGIACQAETARADGYLRELLADEERAEELRKQVDVEVGRVVKAAEACGVLIGELTKCREFQRLEREEHAKEVKDLTGELRDKEAEISRLERQLGEYRG